MIPVLAPRRGIIAAADATAGGFGLLDDFNRANENPLSNGGQWTIVPGATVGGSGSLQVSSNQCTYAGTSSGANDHGMYWNPLTALTNCAVQITVPTLPASGNRIRLWLRLNTSSGATYFAQIVRSGTSGIFRNSGSGSSTSITTGTITMVAGDIYKFSAVGTALTVTQNGTTVLSGTDATYASGAIGIGAFDTTVRLDDCNGGAI